MCFVNRTFTFQVALRFACILPVFVNTSLEKAGATIATVNTVVFAGRFVSAHFTVNVQKSIAFPSQEKKEKN
jgi:hypothetical protein